MADDRTRRRDVALAAAAMAVPLAVAVVVVAAPRSFPTADNAIIELQVRDVPSHLPLYGVYSRFGFHHPGPAMFLWLAPFYRALGVRGLIVGPAVLHALTLAACAWVLHRRGGRPLLLLGTATLLLLERSMASELVDVWNPWLALTPFALAALLAWSVWCEDWWALPPLVGVVSFVVQTHLSYGIVTIALVGVALAALALHRRPRCPTPVLLVAAGVAVVLWCLPLLEQVRRDPGNLSLILRAAREPSEPAAGWGKAADAITQTLGVRAPWLTGAEQLEPFTNRVSGAPLWTLLPTVLAVGSAAAFARRRRRHDALVLQGIAVGSAVAAFVAVANITGEPYPYITRWLWVVGALVWASAAWSGLDAWLAGRPDRPPPRSAGRAGMVAVGLVAVVAAVAGSRATYPRPDASLRIDHTLDAVLAAVPAGEAVLVRYEGPGWAEEQTGYIAALEREGRVGLGTDDQAFQLGAYRTPIERRPDAELIVAIDSKAIGAHLARGEQPLVAWDPLSPAERADFDALRLRLASEYDLVLQGVRPPDPVPMPDRERAERFHQLGPAIAIFLHRPAPAA